MRRNVEEKKFRFPANVFKSHFKFSTQRQLSLAVCPVSLFGGRNTVKQMLKGHSPSDGVVDLDADRYEIWTSSEDTKKFRN